MQNIKNSTKIYVNKALKNMTKISIKHETIKTKNTEQYPPPHLQKKYKKKNKSKICIKT